MSAFHTTRWLVLTAFLCWGPAQAADGPSRDGCSDNFPASLSKRLAQEYPSLRLPRLSDYQRRDVTYFRKSTGRSCPGVVFGDFDGDRIMDVAVVLVDPNNKAPRFVIALRRETDWALYTPEIWCNYAPACYVDTLEPGLYESTQSHEGDKSDPKDRASLRTKNTSVLAGKFESTGVMYAFSEGQWVYVVLSE